MSGSNKGESDMREWKAGDLAMVEIARMWEGGYAIIKANSGPHIVQDRIHRDYLRPLPPSLTPEAAAVLVAADAAERDEIGSRDRLCKAVRAYRATQSGLAEAPKEPVFKVGDRVRVIRRAHVLTDREGTITQARLERPSYVVDFGRPVFCETSDNRTTWEFYPDGLELVSPTPDAIAAAKERVVEAAREQRQAIDKHGLLSVPARSKAIATAVAAKALDDILTPPDPRAELIAAAEAVQNRCVQLPNGAGVLVPTDTFDSFLAALSAAKGAEDSANG